MYKYYISVYNDVNRKLNSARKEKLIKTFADVKIKSYSSSYYLEDSTMNASIYDNTIIVNSNDIFKLQYVAKNIFTILEYQINSTTIIECTLDDDILVKDDSDSDDEVKKAMSVLKKLIKLNLNCDYVPLESTFIVGTDDDNADNVYKITISLSANALNIKFADMVDKFEDILKSFPKLEDFSKAFKKKIDKMIEEGVSSEQ